jgi:hypothetical protein
MGCHLEIVCHMVCWQQGQLKPLAASTLPNSFDMPHIYAEQRGECWDSPTALMVVHIQLTGTGTMASTHCTSTFMASMAITSLIITQGSPLLLVLSLSSPSVSHSPLANSIWLSQASALFIPSLPSFFSFSCTISAWFRHAP